MPSAALKKADSINMQPKKLKTVKKTQKIGSALEGSVKDNYETKGYAPKWLPLKGQHHYRKLVQSLKDAGLYNPLDTGLIEQASAAYAETRDESLTFKERQSARDQYARLVAQLGERGGVKATVEEVGSEDDLKEFVLS